MGKKQNFRYWRLLNTNFDVKVIPGLIQRYNLYIKSWGGGAIGRDALDLGSRTVTGYGGSNPFRPTITK